VFLSIALVTHYTPVLETKGRRTRGFVKKMKMKRYREGERESLELKGTDLSHALFSFSAFKTCQKEREERENEKINEKKNTCH